MKIYLQRTAAILEKAGQTHKERIMVSIKFTMPLKLNLQTFQVCHFHSMFQGQRSAPYVMCKYASYWPIQNCAEQ